MIRQLSIAGFKAFAETQHIPLAPISLVFGPNSSGKSSLIHGLILLKQTLEEGESSEVSLVFNGRLVSLGGFSDMIHGRVGNQPIRIRVEPGEATSLLERYGIPKWVPPFQMWYEVAFAKRRGAAQVVEISAGFSGQRDAALTFTVEKDNEFEDELGTEDPAEPTVLSLRHIGNEFFDVVYQLFTNSLEDIEHPGQQVLRHPAGKDLGVSVASGIVEEWRTLHRDDFEREFRQVYADDAISLYHFLAQPYPGAARSLNLGLNEWLESLSPDRRFAATTDYRASLMNTAREFETDPDSDPVPVARRVLQQALRSRWAWLSPSATLVGVGQQVQRALKVTEYLAGLREPPDRYYMAVGSPAPTVGRTGKYTPDMLREVGVRANVNMWLGKFGIPYSIELVEINGEAAADLVFVRLQDTSTGIFLSPADVGVGVSQVLPVIVQAIASRNKVLVIEEPESHLHPRLQSMLANLFVHSFREYGNQFIVETHSEHLILRLQRLIRTGEIENSAVSVIYMMKQERGAQAYPLRLDTDGSFLDEWPEGFFPERLEEVL